MPIRFDIATSLTDNDLVIKDNDFFFFESDEIHIADTINANPGDWKENPIDGVSIIRYVNSGSNNFQQLSRKIMIELSNDGYVVSTPVITFDLEGRLTINPNATII